MNVLLGVCVIVSKSPCICPSRLKINPRVFTLTWGQQRFQILGHLKRWSSVDAKCSKSYAF